MSNGVAGKVIKPPIEGVMSGRLIKPTKKLLYKLWVKALALVSLIWGVTMLSFIGLSYLISRDSKYAPAPQIIADWFGPINFWTIILNLIWLVPYVLLAPSYVKSIEYSVKSESGETMPEIYVKKGIVTVSRKHVPFRTITNIESKAGPFDRLLGIGNVSVETAGYSGTQQTGPEEKLEGIVFYEEVRDFILKALREYRSPYTTAAEPPRREEPVPGGPGLDDEILITLREIRDLLRKNG